MGQSQFAWNAARTTGKPVYPHGGSSSLYLGQEGNEHRIHGLGYDVVMKMATPFLNKNRHIFFDNFFSSSFLFDCLLAQNTYACGTVRCNRKDLPPCAKQKLKQGEIVTAQRGALVFTKWHDKRDISFLSTNVSPSEPSRPVQRKKKGQNIEIQKPRVADVYTAFMGGVDRADQLRSFYYTGWQSRKWYRYIFWFLFNLSICNAFVLFNIHRGERRKKPLLDFRLELAKQLIGGFSQRKRKRRSLDVPSETAVDPGQHISVHVEGRKRKCVACIKAGRRTPKGYKGVLLKAGPRPSGPRPATAQRPNGPKAQWPAAHGPRRPPDPAARRSGGPEAR